LVKRLLRRKFDVIGPTGGGGLRRIEGRASDGERKPQGRHMDEQPDPADEG
jgi:hypothetical protein